MNNADQQLMKWAYDVVSARMTQETEAKQKYRTQVYRAPAFIQTCGLMQLVAFAAEKEERRVLLHDLAPMPGISDHLVGEGEPWKRLLDLIATCETDEYVRYTRRVQHGLTFLKRMTGALLVIPEPVPQNDGVNG